MKTPDYILIEDYKMSRDMFSTKVLPAGAFVRPISTYYLPAHIKDSIDYRIFNPKTQVFCYTPLGIAVIPLELMRQV